MLVKISDKPSPPIPHSHTCTLSIGFRRHCMYNHRVYNRIVIRLIDVSCGSTSIIYLYGFFVFFLRCGHGLCNNENESKNNIKQKDPKLYNIINHVFLNNNETKMANLGNCVTWPRSCEQYKRRWDTFSVNNSVFEPFRGSSNRTKQDEVSIHIHCGEQTRIVVLILAI